ncbi:MAG: YXWGXW repeat-containing protein [Opitutaceae bacterium]
MNSRAFSAVAARRSLASPVRVACLGALLCGSLPLFAVEPAAQIPDAAQVSPAPLVDKPLPPSTADTVGDQPSAEHVYISGHWRWQDGAYVWDAGHWEMPPTDGASWVAPRWEKRDNGYVLIEGYWQEATAEASEANDSAAEIVEQAPPPPEREIIIERPSPAHVWLGGYWTYRAGRHVWISGRWDLPPRPDVIWVTPHWVRRGHGYVFVDGCWRDRGYLRPRTSVVVESDGWRSDGVITIAPPPIRIERHRPPRPGFEFVWIDGYWGWHGGRHVWIGGHWDRPPHGHHHWRQPRWEHRGGGYVFIQGRWD